MIWFASINSGNIYQTDSDVLSPDVLSVLLNTFPSFLPDQIVSLHRNK